MYLFQYVRNGEFVQSQRITGCVPAGDIGNPAVFWGMSYYRLLPIDQLKHLAACMVVAAGEIGNTAIGGSVFIVSLILMYAVKATGTLRISKEGEIEGLDMHEHGGHAYPEHIAQQS